MDSGSSPWQGRIFGRAREKRCATWDSQAQEDHNRPVSASGSFPAGADCDDTEDSTYTLTYNTKEYFEPLLLTDRDELSHSYMPR